MECTVEIECVVIEFEHTILDRTKRLGVYGLGTPLDDGLIGIWFLRVAALQSSNDDGNFEFSLLTGEFSEHYTANSSGIIRHRYLVSFV